MKQSRRSFFSFLSGALLVGGAPALARKRRKVVKLALVSHSLGWEDGHGGQEPGQFASIAAARKAGFPDDRIVVPPSHVEPPEGAHDFRRW